MNQKLLFVILLITTSLLIPKNIFAQTIIGETIPPSNFSLLELSTSKIKGGLRMPQISTTHRDSLTTPAFKTNVKARGLVIYNTHNQCIEYWNTTRWVSMCTGNADITFSPTIPETPFTPDGGNIGPFTPLEPTPCTGQIPYTFNVITGNTYTTINVINTYTGEFTVSMDQNPTSRPRTAIVRITNNCTSEYKEILFSQSGNSDLCNTTTAKPTISITNGGILCTGGAVYMHITNIDATATYIWTINDEEKGRGTTFTATHAGTYKVYVNGIGCDDNASDKITIRTTGTLAPNNPVTLYASNNGIICTTTPVSLMAFNVPTSGTLIWYKNGIKTTKTGNPISLTTFDEGNWFAVIENGTCTSTPSSSITIQTDNTSSSLVVPIVHVNSQLLTASSTFCINGRLELLLSNFASYPGAITIKWYNAEKLLGSGERLSVIAPSSGDFILRCVVTDNSGVVCARELITTNSLSGTAPATPGITATPAFICGGIPAQLTATIPATSYKWYKDGTLLPTETTQNISVSQTGSYQVEAVNASGCISSMSAPIAIGISDFPKLTWQSTHTTAETNQVLTFQVLGAFDPTAYTWTVNNGAIIQNGQGTNIVSIIFPNNGNTNINVTATNSCGISDVLTQAVVVANACTPITIRSTSITPTSNVLVAGSTLSMSVTASGTDPLTYQWKRDGINVGTNSPQLTINNITVAHSGAYTCEVTNTCSGPITANIGSGKITIIDTNIIATGVGTFSGSTCFDIAYSNDNSNSCGSLASRITQKADFSQTTTNTQTYTFTPSGTISNVRFIYANTNGSVITSLTPDANYTGNNINKPCTVKAVYESSLNTTAQGLISTNALTADIYVIYNDRANGTGTDRKIKLNVSVKDCACCGAYIAPGEWKNFMCHNLGADESLDAFTPARGINGNYYQWGRPIPIATVSSPGVITGASLLFPGNNLWNDTTKTVHDPCPTGYRIPTHGEWAGVIANNSRQFISNSNQNFRAGLLIGKALFLPFSGEYNTWRANNHNTRPPTLVNRDQVGCYWASSSNSQYRLSWLYLGSFGVETYYSDGDYAYGRSIRCIAE